MCSIINNYYSSAQGASNTTYINLAITASNLIIGFVLNFVVYSPRRKNERNYQLKAAIYKSFVIDNLKLITAYPSNLIGVAMNIDGSNRSAIVERKIEAACDEIEALNTEFTNSIIPIILNYNEDMAKDLTKIADQLYDEATKLVTLILAEDSSVRPSPETFLRLTSDFHSRFSVILKKYRPEV